MSSPAAPSLRLPAISCFPVGPGARPSLDAQESGGSPVLAENRNVSAMTLGKLIAIALGSCAAAGNGAGCKQKVNPSAAVVQKANKRQLRGTKIALSFFLSPHPSLQAPSRSPVLPWAELGLPPVKQSRIRAARGSGLGPRAIRPLSPSQPGPTSDAPGWWIRVQPSRGRGNQERANKPFFGCFAS